MRHLQVFALACLAVLLSHGHVYADAKNKNPGQGVILETLLKTRLEGVAGTEVVVSRVVIPPHTSLPRHWHPGEEFAYVIEGSVTLKQEGREDVVTGQGDVVKVPLKQVHTGMTGKEGVELLVFRVHEQGQPERVLVD